MKNPANIRYPTAVRLLTHSAFQAGLMAFVLCLGLYYVVAWHVYTPLTGVEVDYSDNSFSALQVASVAPGSPAQAAGLQAGDQLLSIDGNPALDTNRPLYTPKRAGQSVHYSVARGGRTLEFDVTAGDYWQHPEYLWGTWALELVALLALLVYALGLVLCLRSARRDRSARLVGALWLLAALALAADGPGYANGGWFVYDVIMVTFALGSYVSLAAHLYFPAPLFSHRARILLLRVQLALALLLLAFYLLERALFAGGDLLPQAFASTALIRTVFYTTWLVDLGLLAWNRSTTREAETRRQANILLAGALLGVLPVLVFTALPQLAFGPRSAILPGSVTVPALVFIPLSYAYVSLQDRLRQIDPRLNRALNFVALFALALGLASVIFGLLAAWGHWSLQMTTLSGGVFVGGLVVYSLRGLIQARSDRLLYGHHYDFERAVTRLSARLAHFAGRPEFDELRVEVAREMCARRSALLLAQPDGRLELPWPGGSSAKIFAHEDETCLFLRESARPALAKAIWAAQSEQTRAAWGGCSWARALFPLVHHDRLHGILLLGGRVTGDYYSENELNDIQTLCRIAALALANLAALESLRSLTLTDEAVKAVGKTLLVVDDDLAALEVSAAVLRAHAAGYRVLKAQGGRAALKTLGEALPDLLLLDLNMPDIDGFAVLEAMQQTEATRHIPVVLLTGMWLDEAQMERLPRNVSAVLNKEMFDWDEITARIQDALLRREKMSSAAQLLMRKVVAYIHAHYAENIIGDDLARHVSVSKDYLSSCFRKEMGATPFEYLTRYRIRRAKDLLDANQLSIGQIARAVGVSISYFSRAFQEEVGVTPSQYRSGQRPPAV
ncbi:MAG: helix-turn-helix domain-containing protein [Anaerolineales bacterium]